MGSIKMLRCVNNEDKHFNIEHYGKILIILPIYCHVGIETALVEDAKAIGAYLRHFATSLLGRDEIKNGNGENGAGKKADGNKNVLFDVLLLHGYFFDKRYMKGMELFLAQEGYCVYSASYPFYDDLARVASEEIIPLFAHRNSNWKKVILIGHSAGGLIARDVAARCPELVERVITLATPHHGTGIAAAGAFTQSGKQMVPSSDYLVRLNSRPIPPRMPFYSIAGKYDLLVPPESTKLEGAQHFLLEDLGHWGIVGKKAHPLLRECLAGNK